MSRFSFEFAASYRLPALVFGITPRTAWIDVADDHLKVRYGPWSLTTPLANIAGTQLTGGFAFIKTAGPPHLSFSDRGISFTTNGERAVCMEFHQPVKGIDPTGRILHPGATITATDVEGLRAAISR